MRRYLLRGDIRRYRNLLGLTWNLFRILLTHEGQYQGSLADATLADEQYSDVASRRDRTLHHAVHRLYRFNNERHSIFRERHPHSVSLGGVMLIGI